MRVNWSFLYDSYTGLGGYEDGSYLVQYPRETPDKYSRRKELAVYPNFVRKIVDTYVAHLFKDPPVRETTDNYARFIDNVDRNGTYIDDFMKKVAKLTLIFGTVFVIVDKPPGRARTKAEELQQGLLPYVTIRLPSQVEEAEIDEYGRLRRISFREDKQWRILDGSTWKIAKDKRGNAIIKEGEHNLGIVPVVPVSWTDPILPSDLLVPPFILDIARLNYDLYNAISELREILRNITFPILTLPIKDEQTASQLKDLTVGTENFIPYNPEGGGEPSFIAPPADPAKVYLEYINFLIEQIYKSVNLEFALGSQTGKSGVALEFEFQQVNILLSGIAGNLEKAEYQIADLVERWMGEGRFHGSISYNRDFSFRDIERDLKTAMDSIALGISSTFEAEMKKKIARDLLGDYVDENVLERIDREIEGLEGLDNQLKSEGL